MIRQLEIERRRRCRRGAPNGRPCDEGARVVFLVGGLGEAAAHVLDRGGDEGTRSRRQREVVGARSRRLELRHRGQAVAVANAAEHRPLPSRNVLIEFRFDRGCPRNASSSLVGLNANSISTPVECALGTLNTTRDEQDPASSVTWRSFIWVWNAAALKRIPGRCTLTPTS